MDGHIYLVLESDVVAANLAAEGFGLGPDSLSIVLTETVGGAPWRGAHSWVDLVQPRPQMWALLPVIVIDYVGGDSVSEWEQALLDNGLEQAPYPPP
jgi:hypothetical protein